jgi:hypothetical protein
VGVVFLLHAILILFTPIRDRLVYTLGGKHKKA